MTAPSTIPPSRPCPAGLRACPGPLSRALLPAAFALGAAAATAWGQGAEGAGGPGPLAVASPGPAGLMLQLSGRPGDRYTIEFNPSFAAPDTWLPFAGLTLEDARIDLVDPTFHARRAGFYRAVKQEGLIHLDGAANFQLIDHDDKVQNLHYNTDQKAVVLIFVSPEALALDATRSAIAEVMSDPLSSTGALFWLVCTTPSTGRDAIRQAAVASGLGLPYLEDPASVVARRFKVRGDLEAVLVNAADWTVFFQGALTGVDPEGEPVPRFADAFRSLMTQPAPAPTPVTMPLAPPGPSPMDLSRRPVNYVEDIAPILAEKCISCHSPGNVGPFAMSSYEAVFNWGHHIEEEVLTGRMPPWSADPAYGTFANANLLSDEQKADIVAWVGADLPRGEGPDPLAELFAREPPPPDYPVTWPAEIGEPDVVLELPMQSIPANGEVDYRYETIAVNLPANAWLRAAVVLPGNLSVVHHVLVSTGSDYSFLRSFAGYAPGTTSGIYPEGTGRRLDGRVTHISFELHYETTGVPETDRTQLGLYFHDRPPGLEYRQAFPVNFLFNIPPGAKEYEPSTVTHTFEQDSWLYSLQPHMHLRGKRMMYEAVYPDQTREVLLSVPHYDFDWQRTYLLAERKFMPAGTRVLVSGAFDNSTLNPDNPDPAASVRWGEQTTDEMFIGFMEYTLAP